MKEAKSRYYLFVGISILSIAFAGLAVSTIASSLLSAEIQPTDTSEDTNSLIAYMSGLIIFLLGFVPAVSFLLARGFYFLLGKRYKSLIELQDRFYVSLYSATAGGLALVYTAFSTLLSLDFGFSFATLIFSLMLVGGVFVWFAANAMVLTAIIKVVTHFWQKRNAESANLRRTAIYR